MADVVTAQSKSDLESAGWEFETNEQPDAVTAARPFHLRVKRVPNKPDNAQICEWNARYDAESGDLADTLVDETALFVEIDGDLGNVDDYVVGIVSYGTGKTRVERGYRARHRYLRGYRIHSLQNGAWLSKSALYYDRYHPFIRHDNVCMFFRLSHVTDNTYALVGGDSIFGADNPVEEQTIRLSDIVGASVDTDASGRGALRIKRELMDMVDLPGDKAWQLRKGLVLLRKRYTPNNVILGEPVSNVSAMTISLQLWVLDGDERFFPFKVKATFTTKP